MQKHLHTIICNKYNTKKSIMDLIYIRTYICHTTEVALVKGVKTKNRCNTSLWHAYSDEYAEGIIVLTNVKVLPGMQ